MKDKKYVLRSMLFVPGHNRRLLEKAVSFNADALVFDLEDSCQPESNKEIGRKLIAEIVKSGIYKKHQIFVRINERVSGFLLKDVYPLMINGIDGFLYPKSRSGEDIYFFDKLLETIEYEKGFEIGKFKIFPVIETAAAVMNAREICAASDRIVALGFGSEDFISDLEGIRDPEGKSIYTPRAIIALAAKGAGVLSIDTPHVDVHNLESLEKHVKEARTLGFDGMQILHPKEIDIVHKYYSYSDEEYAEALEIIRLYEEAKTEGRGVAVMDGKFIAPPIVARADNVIRRTKLIQEFIKWRKE